MATKGLEGVVVAQSEICKIYGEQGRLIYRGYEIEDLAGNATFEEVCHLLWFGELPTTAQLKELRSEFAAGRPVDHEIFEILRRLPTDTHPMAVLRTGVSALAAFDPDAEEMSEEANLRKSIRLTAQMTTLTAAWERLRNGKDPVEPKAGHGLAEGLLYMMHGEEPDELHTRIIDAAFTLHAEHGMNASTFAARVTIATLADLHSAVTSAIGTLKGPLHGGANERVMEMLQEIGEADRASDWVRAALDRGQKVMGFGHRVYRALDPRAPILKKLAEELSGGGGTHKWLDISERIEATMAEEMERRGKKIYPNVDFFSASVYYTLGIPTDTFTNLFAIARTSGWTAHILEQLRDNRLIRPQTEYIGPEGKRVEPIGQRG